MKEGGNIMSTSEFFKGYKTAAFWTEEEEINPDHELSEESEKLMRADTDRFYEANFQDLQNISGGWSQAGHDYWLTRNGHGAGFWDLGHGAIGDKLTKYCEMCGPAHLSDGDTQVHYDVDKW